MSDRIKVMLLSDPPTQPTGFGRGTRELLSFLPRDRFEVAVLARGWMGSSRFDAQTYVADSQDIVCSHAFGQVAADFGTPFILWTLVDPWMTGWLSHPQKNAYSVPRTREWIERHRADFRWVGYYPVDGEGYGRSAPFWYEDFLNGPDHTVFMSEFGRRSMEPFMGKPFSVISHAVNVNQFNPMVRLKEEERETLKTKYNLAGRHVVLSVMANRRRKLWPEVIQAFALALREAPDLHLLAACLGDVKGSGDGTWDIAEMCRIRGLLPEDPKQARVTFLGPVAEKVLATAYDLADQAVLLSTGEGFGLPQLEAHASGIPCTVGAYSASEELVLDAHEVVYPKGYTYDGNNLVKRPVYNVGDVVDAILYWRDHDSARRAMVARGFEQAQERAWDKIGPLWVNLFEEVWSELTEESEPSALKEEESDERAEAVVGA